ncbi:hypothetical protein B0T10DRAFT_147758 [Thelonectria olida]|uniref:Uncharacterized protein n=1 Tax=Thelonectria olida TaxID=1576542 RepID=A0A9P9AN07_9HYPO|nr:hypothetical protein B0T10DRAFT_147758 [Thelonectria olida]
MTKLPLRMQPANERTDNQSRTRSRSKHRRSVSFSSSRRQIVSSKRHRRLCVSNEKAERIQSPLVVDTQNTKRWWTSVVFVALQDVITRTSTVQPLDKAKTAATHLHPVPTGRKGRIARSPIASIRIQHVLHLQTRGGWGWGARDKFCFLLPFRLLFLASCTPCHFLSAEICIHRTAIPLVIVFSLSAPLRLWTRRLSSSH